MDPSPTTRLRGGLEIPALGLGVYQSAPGPETQQAVRWALELGYRHIDTARVYRNESDVGEALRASGVPREQVFITTKLWNADQGYESAIAACRKSLQQLGLEYLDLYLIHWPVPEKRLESWRALEQLQKDGLCRAIGVSNFMVHHLEELLGASAVVPQVNQVEMHPFLAQRELRDFCREKGIVLEAYSPLTRGERLRHPAIARVAERCGKSPAQVLIRWALEQGAVVLPKSVRRERIEENGAVFDFQLSEQDRAELDSLDEGFHTCWDPTAAP